MFKLIVVKVRVARVLGSHGVIAAVFCQIRERFLRTGELMQINIAARQTGESLQRLE